MRAENSAEIKAAVLFVWGVSPRDSLVSICNLYLYLSFILY